MCTSSLTYLLRTCFSLQPSPPCGSNRRDIVPSDGSSRILFIQRFNALWQAPTSLVRHHHQSNTSPYYRTVLSIMRSKLEIQSHHHARLLSSIRSRKERPEVSSRERDNLTPRKACPVGDLPIRALHRTPPPGKAAAALRCCTIHSLPETKLCWSGFMPAASSKSNTR